MTDSTILAEQLLQIIPPVMQTLSSELRKTGQLMSPSHFSVMVMLHYHTCNLTELAEYQGVSLPTMSSTVSRLEEKGLVRRIRATADRRVVNVELTPAGKNKLFKIQEFAEASIGRLLGDLSPKDQKSLAVGLEILSAVFNIDEMLQDE